MERGGKEERKFKVKNAGTNLTRSTVQGLKPQAFLKTKLPEKKKKKMTPVWKKKETDWVWAMLGGISAIFGENKKRIEFGDRLQVPPRKRRKRSKELIF